MSMSDPLADMIARIRNGQKARKAQVAVPAAKLHTAVLGVLKDEGYIRGFADKEIRKGVRETIVDLRYHEGQPAIREIERISSPGRRVYSGIKTLARPHGGLGVAIVSTPQGVMSDSAARTKNVGGEVICRVY
ncbi:MAG: 30S ribosomal protein S8 [Alphaproteobacteria bacterium]